MKLIDSTQIRVKIGNIKRSQASARENVHEAACFVIGHALAHGTSPFATLLVSAMSTQADRKLVAQWLEACGPFVPDGDDVVFSKKKRASDKGLFADVKTPEDIEAYLDTLNEDSMPQWWEAKLGGKKKNPAAKDAVELAQKLIKSLKRAHSDDDTPPVDNIGLLSYLEGAIARYTSDMALAKIQEEAQAAERAEEERLTLEALERHRAEEEQREQQHTVPERDEVAA